MNAIHLTAVAVLVFLVKSSNGRSVSPPQQYNVSRNATGVTNTSSENLSNATTTNGCSPAFQLPNTTSKCHRFYDHSDSLCNLSIPADTLLYINMMEQRIRDHKLKSVRIKPEFFRNLLPNPAALLRQRCFQLIQDVYCHHYFPRCDMTSGTPQAQAICREACEMLNFMCKPAWFQLMSDYPGVTWYAQEEIGEKMHEHETFEKFKKKNILMKCDGLPRMDGPEIPECYIPKHLLYDKTKMEIGNGKSQDCFYGNGFAYGGNVSRTMSGYECQSWSEQCPHRHFRTPENYKELIGAGNACRNPGHQASLGPWCFTMNPLVRWEYCNITRCSKAQIPKIIHTTLTANSSLSPKVIPPLNQTIKSTNSSGSQ